MPEPTSTTAAAGAALVAIAVSLLGPKFGPIATVVFAALAGAFVSVGEVPTTGRVDALVYMLRYTVMAATITGALVFLLERYSGLPATEMLALVAFLIGWIGNRWQGLRDSVLEALRAIAGRKGGSL